MYGVLENLIAGYGLTIEDIAASEPGDLIPILELSINELASEMVRTSQMLEKESAYVGENDEYTYIA
jgi:hypothetical protein